MYIRVTPAGLADGLGLGMSYGLKTDAPLVPGSPTCCGWRST